MAGRRRRPSTSTVASVDNSAIRYVSETEVLRPLGRNASNENSNEWPAFVLKDATIYHKDGKRLANVLLDPTNIPFVVRGQLDVEKEQQHFLQKQSGKQTHIEIQASFLYSMGYGPVTLWMSGAAGWFEIIPAPEYEAIYHEMREAITLYYEIMDVFEGYQEVLAEYKGMSKHLRRKTPAPEAMTLDNLFLKYAVAVGDGSYRDEVEARCHKWAVFLIHHFPKETDFQWNTTLFHEWIIQQHPDVEKKRLKAAGGTAVARISATTNLEDSITRPTRNSPSSRLRSHGSADIEMLNTSGHKVSKPTSRHETQTPPAQVIPDPPPNTQRDINPESPLGLLMALVDEAGVEHHNFLKITWKTVCSKIWNKCSVKNYDVPGEMVDLFAKELLANLDDRWKVTPFYKDLKAAAARPRKAYQHIIPDKNAAQLRRRQKKQVVPSTAPSTALPPAIVIRSKEQHSGQTDDSDSDADMPRGGRRIGGLRLASASKKRTAADMEDHQAGGRRGKKPFNMSHTITDEDEPALDEDEDDEDEESDEPAVPAQDGTRLFVQAEKIPSMSPAGPNGTWVCDQEGCGFIVRSAEEPAGQDLIQRHFRDHEKSSEMVNLALSEGRLGHMPISHLIDKIQSTSQNRRSGAALSGGLLPVKRGLLV